MRWQGLSAAGVHGGLVALAFMAGLWGGCVDDGGLQRLCLRDDECPRGFVCLDGQCRCATDASCEAHEICNPQGFCQNRVGCETSLDCPDGMICDRATGNCIDRARCTDDVQCALGEICDGVRFECREGCRDLSDCRLGSVCECPDPESSCNVGQCVEGPCADDSFCRYGEICVEEFPGEPKRCVRDDRGPFCDACSIPPGAGGWHCPGEGRNFCLVDTSHSWGGRFCGVDCADGQGCPWGFSCNDVLRLTESTCGPGGRTEFCPARPRSCSTDAQCPSGECDTASGQCRCSSDRHCLGGECDLEAGVCRGTCVVTEGRLQGFCTCLTDDDCPAESCNPNTATCTISGRPCDVDDPLACGRVYCKHVPVPRQERQIGYCHIGRNCAPVKGISCDMVREARQ